MTCRRIALLAPIAIAIWSAAAICGDEPQYVRGLDQFYEIACAGDTVAFDIHAWSPTKDDWVPSAEDSAGKLLMVSALEVRRQGVTIPYRDRSRGDHGLVFRWIPEDSTKVYSVTIPWRDVTLLELDEPIACERIEAIIPPPGDGSPAAEQQEAFRPYDEPPVPVKLFTPEYPSQARQGKIEGVVHVRMTIGETGRVLEASVHRSDTVGVLEEAAVEAAKLSIYRPAMLDGVPIRSRTVFPFRFRAN
jgi:TonB family protein